MTAEQKRNAIYAEHIRQLRDVAEDKALNKNWMVFCFREIFRALEEALAEVEDD